MGHPKAGTIQAKIARVLVDMPGGGIGHEIRDRLASDYGLRFAMHNLRSLLNSGVDRGYFVAGWAANPRAGVFGHRKTTRCWALPARDEPQRLHRYEVVCTDVDEHPQVILAGNHEKAAERWARHVDLGDTFGGVAGPVWVDVKGEGERRWRQVAISVVEGWEYGAHCVSVADYESDARIDNE